MITRQYLETVYQEIFENLDNYKKKYNLNIKEILTVIVPAYNVESYLERCIASLEQQGDIIKTIIIVNDGSTDGTLAAAKKLQEDNAKILVVSQENRGTLQARCTGIELAGSPYITFVDADDYIEPLFYEKAVRILEKSELDILEFGLVKINNGNIMYKFQPDLDCADVVEGIRRILEKDSSMLSSSNKIFSRHLFDWVKENKEVRLCHEEDKLINIRALIHANGIAYIPSIGYYYDLREGSASNSKKSIEYISILKSGELSYQCICSNMPVLSKTMGYDYCAHLAYCYGYLEFFKDDVDRESIQQKILEEFRKVYNREGLKDYKPQKTSWKRLVMIWMMKVSPPIFKLAYKLLVN